MNHQWTISSWTININMNKPSFTSSVHPEPLDEVHHCTDFSGRMSQHVLANRKSASSRDCSTWIGGCWLLWVLVLLCLVLLGGDCWLFPGIVGCSWLLLGTVLLDIVSVWFQSLLVIVCCGQCLGDSMWQDTQASYQIAILGYRCLWSISWKKQFY